MATKLEDFADWVHEVTGVPVALELGERGSPIPPVPYFTVRSTSRSSQRISAPHFVSDPGAPAKATWRHRVLWEELIRITAYAETEMAARDAIEGIRKAQLLQDTAASLAEKNLAMTWISETISLGPGEEWAFADVRIWWAEDLNDSIYMIETANTTLTVS